MELKSATPPPPAMAISGSASAARLSCFEGFQVQPGQRADDFEMAEFFRSDIHQKILAFRIIAVQALD
jgi:hypothetical protein